MPARQIQRELPALFSRYATHDDHPDDRASAMSEYDERWATPGWPIVAVQPVALYDGPDVARNDE